MRRRSQTTGAETGRAVRGRGVGKARRESSRSTVVCRLAISNVTQADVIHKSGIHIHLSSDLLEYAEGDAIESRVLESTGLVLAQWRANGESDDYIVWVLLYANNEMSGIFFATGTVTFFEGISGVLQLVPWSGDGVQVSEHRLQAIRHFVFTILFESSSIEGIKQSVFVCGQVFRY